MDDEAVNKLISTLDGGMKEEMTTLFERLRICESKASEAGDFGSQLRSLFARLEAVEVKCLVELGGTPDMVTVLERLQRAEAQLRDKDLAGPAPTSSSPPQPVAQSPPTIAETTTVPPVPSPPTATPVKKSMPPQDVTVEPKLTPSVASKEPAPPPPVSFEPKPTAPKAPPAIVIAPAPTRAPHIELQKSPVSAVKQLSTLSPIPAPASPASTYSYDQLKAGAAFPDDVDVSRRERYLSDDDFKIHIGVTRAEFDKYPKWKQDSKKKSAALF